MLNVNCLDIMAEVTGRMADGGVFLTVDGDRPNTMTIGWGTMGFCWGKPTMMVMVRPSRHTFDLMEAAGRFSVSMPAAGALKEELRFAGTASGRDQDKFSGHGLTAAPGIEQGIWIVDQCPLHIECAVRDALDMTGDRLDPGIMKRAYRDGDLHRLYFAEIIHAYRTDKS